MKTTLLQHFPDRAPEMQKNQDDSVDFGNMMQMLTGYWVSSCLYAVARLGIADLLKSGPISLIQLAEATETHPDYLYRVLRALSGKGVFRELPEKYFEQTSLSSLLASDAPGSLRSMAMMLGEEHYHVWGNLLNTVKTGDDAFETVYGIPLFEYFQKNPEPGEIFNASMTGFATGMHRAVVSVYDFSRFHTLVDVGGGHGTLLTNILCHFPQLRGVLFDLPHVVAGAQIPPELSDRFCKVGGDFFSAVQQGGDAYILSHVIHDWSDDMAVAILQNIHHALPQDGTLLLVENVVEPDNQPAFAKFLDINMMLMTEGGRERTSAEYEALFAKAGFELTRIIPIPSLTCVLEGRKR